MKKLCFLGLVQSSENTVMVSLSQVSKHVCGTWGTWACFSLIRKV